MDHLDAEHYILYIATEKYLPLSESTTEDEQKPWKEYKGHKINFAKLIGQAHNTL
ncbi:hypothetical protein I79_022122 [Cricetulus griseus]|uniref:Uncharacterized protein n=1 Tax=Cricetulus griseus TaxID=10029 RepID=G3IEH5_CRIGR|nr:hypothetical protein I79_022122 [Cricetulus griseus]